MVNYGKLSFHPFKTKAKFDVVIVYFLTSELIQRVRLSKNGARAAQRAENKIKKVEEKKEKKEKAQERKEVEKETAHIE